LADNHLLRVGSTHFRVRTKINAMVRLNMRWAHATAIPGSGARFTMAREKELRNGEYNSTPVALNKKLVMPVALATGPRLKP